MARTIALDPALILYDEPFAGLDPISMGVTAKLIRSLSDSLHATSIVVTHDVAETFEIADYVYMISSGVVAAEGTPDELRSSTESFVTQFIRGESDGPVRFIIRRPIFGSTFSERNQHDRVDFEFRGGRHPGSPAASASSASFPCRCCESSPARGAGP